MKLVKVVAILAVILIVVAGALLLFRDVGTPAEDPVDVPTPNQILYGIKYNTSVKYDFEAVKKSIEQDERYAEFTLRDEYCMIYQINNEEKELKVKGLLGIEEALPDLDYSKSFLLLSVGREIYDLDDRTKRLDGDNQPILDIMYSEKAYKPDTVFVYTMNTEKISSGDSLEYYYWENADPRSNLVFDDSYEKEIISEGKYHTLYLRNDKKYVYRLYDSMGEEIKKRAVSDVPVNIVEHGDTIIRIETDKKTVYYNPKKNMYSEEYTVPTGYLVYNIITYMRLYDGEIQLILRDAYDKLFYAKIVRLPFTEDRENIHELVKSVEVIDDTSVWVEYYKGEKRELVREIVEVYNLKR